MGQQNKPLTLDDIGDYEVVSQPLPDSAAAALTLDDIGDYEVVSQPEQPSRVTERDLINSPKFASDSKQLYFLNEGSEAEPLDSDSEYAKYGLRYMGWFNYNLPKMGLEATQLTKATDEQKQAFVDVMDAYDEKAPSLMGAVRAARGILTDPTTYVGVGTFGAGLAGGQAFKQGIKTGVKQSMKEGLKQGAKVGALEGAVYTAADDALRQSVNIQAGRQEGFDFGQSAKAAGIGSVIGGTLGAGVGTLAGRSAGKRQQDAVEADIKLSEDQPVSIGKEVAPYSEEIARRVDEEMSATLPKDFRASAKIDLQRDAVKVGVNVLHKLGKPIAPDEKISDQIFEAIQLTPHIPEYKDAFSETLKDTDMSLVELAGNLRLDVSDAGRTMQAYSAAVKDIARVSDEIAGIIEPDPMGPKIAKSIRDLDNVRRGMMVSAPATAIRNATAQIGRIGMHTLSDVYDETLNLMFNPLRKAFGAEARPVDYSRAFSLITNLTKDAKKAKELTDLTLKYSDYSKNRLFNNYASDVSDVTSNTTFRRTQKFVDTLNFFNRVQEYHYRRGMFAASLDKSLRERGSSMQEVLEAGDDAFRSIGGKPPLLREEDIRKAVDDSLDFTYAKEPNNALLKGMVKLANSVPFATTALVPFARFMANAMEFQFKHSPLGFTQLLHPNEIKKIVSGDYKTFSQAAIGSAALLAAIEAKRDGHTGNEKWYEIRVGDQTYDTRAYFPLTPYFLVADVIVRSEKGLRGPDASDIIQGLTGAQFRAGTGLYLIDKFIEDMRGVMDSEKRLSDVASRFVSDTLTPYLTPIRTFSDVFIEPFRGEEARKYRDPAAVSDGFAESVMRRFQSQIPILKESLPEAESPTRAAAGARPEKAAGLPASIAKQFLGITAREKKNPAEREFDRLGFKRGDILPYSGNKEYDREMAKNLGPLVEAIVSPIVESEEYQSLSNPAKSRKMKLILTLLRKPARSRVLVENPEAFLRRGIGRLNQDDRLILFRKFPELMDFMKE